MAYIGSSPTKVVSRQSANIFTYTATANQTAFTGADANGNTLACSPSDIMVHMNGIRLEESDYTATTTTVTLGSGAAAGDEVTITAFLTFESADHYTKSAADTRYVNASGDTMSGDLTIDTNTFHVDVADNRVGVGTTSPYRLFSVSSSTTRTSGFEDIAEYVTPSIGVGGSTSLNVGRVNSSYDLGKMAFKYNGAGSTSNQLGFGFYGADNLLKLDGAGRVTSPNQPSFSVRSNGGNSGNTWTQDNVIKFQTVQHNVGTHYSTSTGRFTAPVNGFYVFHYAGFGYNGGLIAATYTTAVSLRVNGSTYVVAVYDMNQSGTGYPSSTASVGLYLTANDYVDMYTSGQGQYADSSNFYTHWSGYLLH